MQETDTIRRPATWDEYPRDRIRVASAEESETEYGQRIAVRVEHPGIAAVQEPEVEGYRCFWVARHAGHHTTFKYRPV